MLAISQTFADVPEGFASISAFKRHGVTRKWRLILTALFLVPLLMGAVIGYFGLRGQAPIWQYSMLAFTGGILFIMTIEEMIPEAHQEEHPRLAALFLSGGFVLFTLVSMVLGE